MVAVPCVIGSAFGTVAEAVPHLHRVLKGGEGRRSVPEQHLGLAVVGELEVDDLRLAGTHDVDVGIPVLALEGAAIPLSGTRPPCPVHPVQSGCGPRRVEPAAALDERLVAPVVGRGHHEVPELLRSGVVPKIGLPGLCYQRHQPSCDGRGEAGPAPGAPCGVRVAPLVQRHITSGRPSDRDDVRIHPPDHVGASVGPGCVLPP